MAWAKVDDMLCIHPKFLGVSLAARGLWITALSWASAMKMGGRIPKHVLASLNGPLRASKRRLSVTLLADELVSAGLWHAEPDGYQIHDFLDYNPRSQDEITRLDPESIPDPSPPLHKEISESPQGKPRTVRATQWPEGFELTIERALVARNLGLDAAVEWAKFKDHALKDGVLHKNWDAAWRYWCRRAVEFHSRRKAWQN